DPNAAVFPPPERYKNRYADVLIPRRPNALDTLEGKPALQRKTGNLPPLGRTTGTSDEAIRNRLRMWLAADEGLGQMLQVLEEAKQLDNTVIVVTSDPGYFYGEHG